MQNNPMMRMFIQNTIMNLILPLYAICYGLITVMYLQKQTII